MTPSLARTILEIFATPLFAGFVVAFAVWIMAAPTWAVVGFGSTALLLTAVMEDHAHGR